MLVACRAEGWQVESYEHPDHPLQRRTRLIIAAFADTAADDVGLATDNCAVPTFRLTVAAAAIAFARLAGACNVSPDLSRAARRVRAAMTHYPEMVGGEDSWDTALMRAGGGSVVSKGGADGFQGIGCVASAMGLAIKVSDGNSRAIPPAVLAVMERLDLLAAGPLSELTAYARIEIRNHQGDRVGSIAPAVDFEASA
jgi:L-asparaginase II